MLDSALHTMSPFGERVAIPVQGCTLDGQLHRTEAPQGAWGLLLVHPYPLLGGSMHDPVVTEVFRRAPILPALGWSGPSLLHIRLPQTLAQLKHSARLPPALRAAAPPPRHRQAAASPAFAAVLRYNQRGVGRSGGSRSIRCRADLEDVPAVVAFLLGALPPGPGPQRIAVVG